MFLTLFFLWCILGFLIAVIVPEKVHPETWSAKQLLFMLAVSGPIMWIYLCVVAVVLTLQAPSKLLAKLWKYLE